MLTDAGTDFMPVVWAMFEWGRKHLTDTGLRLEHLDCGAEATVEIVCGEGHSVPPDELGVRLIRRTRRKPLANRAASAIRRLTGR